VVGQVFGMTAHASAPAPGRERVDPAESAADAKSKGDDRLRHIICIVCYPAFDGALEAPHDAECVCGRPVRAGDRRNPAATAQCVLCDGLWAHHAATVHAGGRA
jgi:hypothetical protein